MIETTEPDKVPLEALCQNSEFVKNRDEVKEFAHGLLSELRNKYDCDSALLLTEKIELPNDNTNDNSERIYRAALSLYNGGTLLQRLIRIRKEYVDVMLEAANDLSEHIKDKDLKGLPDDEIKGTNPEDHFDEERAFLLQVMKKFVRNQDNADHLSITRLLNMTLSEEDFSDLPEEEQVREYAYNLFKEILKEEIKKKNPSCVAIDKVKSQVKDKVRDLISTSMPNTSMTSNENDLPQETDDFFEQKLSQFSDLVHRRQAAVLSLVVNFATENLLIKATNMNHHQVIQVLEEVLMELQSSNNEKEKL